MSNSFDAGNMFMDVFAFTLILAVLVAMSNTSLYPVALGAVIIALVYVLMNENVGGVKAATWFSQLLGNAGKQLNQS